MIGPFTLPGNMYAYDYQLPGGKSVTGMINDLAPQFTAAGRRLVGPVRQRPGRLRDVRHSIALSTWS